MEDQIIYPCADSGDLVNALHDLDHGKRETPLLAIDEFKKGIKTGEGTAYDYIIAARRYLLTNGIGEADAERRIAKALQSKGCHWITSTNVDSIQRGHSRESAEKAGVLMQRILALIQRNVWKEYLIILLNY